MKASRKITVEDKRYIWSLEGNEIYSANLQITVVLESTSYSRLYLDPYGHDFKIAPKSIAASNVAARSFGWCPEDNTGDLHLKSEDGENFELQNI